MEEPLLQWFFDQVRKKQIYRGEYRDAPGWRKLQQWYRPQECRYQILQGLAHESERQFDQLFGEKVDKASGGHNLTDQH